METMPERWDGPFDEGRVFNLLVRMREGATVQLYRTCRGASVEEAELLGRFEKARGGSVLADAPGLGPRFSGERVGLLEAARKFARSSTEYVLHDSQWAGPETSSPVVGEVTPELREMVKKVVEDPGSGGSGPLERSKRRYWRAGGGRPHFLAESALLALGYKDTPQEVLDDLAPMVEEAFEIFKEKRPDLEP